jgi:hypothetical protein
LSAGSCNITAIIVGFVGVSCFIRWLLLKKQ